MTTSRETVRGAGSDAVRDMRSAAVASGVDPAALAPDGDVVLAPTGPGVLDGVRVVVKDLVDVAGHVTAAGNPTLAAGPAATTHASAVRSVLAAGATLVGRTATDELAMGMFGVNSHYGTPPNPAAPDRVPGGSSSGSASAVAAGTADLGIGTDTGGSIRTPAAFCGLLGLRPSHGRIDVAGVRPMAAGFDTVGLLARDVDVLARGLAALTPPALTQPRDVDEVVLLADLLALAADEVAARTRAAAAEWAGRLGLSLRSEPLLPGAEPAELVRVFWPLMSRQLWEANGAWVAEADPVLGAGLAERIADAGRVSDTEVAAAQAEREALRVRLAALLARGVAVLPTTVDAPPLRTTEHAALMAWRDRNLALVVPASLTGAPQLSVPIGRVDGPAGTDAPVAASLLGLPGDDELLVRLAGEVLA